MGASADQPGCHCWVTSFSSVHRFFRSQNRSGSAFSIAIALRRRQTRERLILSILIFAIMVSPSYFKIDTSSFLPLKLKEFI
jgi:hypothetical protein